MVRKALRQISPDLRVVLVLREIEGLSYEEIAEKLKIPLGTVKSRVNRGRIQMAQTIMGQKGGKQ